MGTLTPLVPSAALVEKVSPMPRMAPPPFGTSSVGAVTIDTSRAFVFASGMCVWSARSVPPCAPPVPVAFLLFMTDVLAFHPFSACSWPPLRPSNRALVAARYVPRSIAFTRSTTARWRAMDGCASGACPAARRRSSSCSRTLPR